jgi:hypothetical protein
MDLLTSTSTATGSPAWSIPRGNQPLKPPPPSNLPKPHNAITQRPEQSAPPCNAECEETPLAEGEDPERVAGVDDTEGAAETAAGGARVVEVGILVVVTWEGESGSFFGYGIVGNGGGIWPG